VPEVMDLKEERFMLGHSLGGASPWCLGFGTYGEAEHHGGTHGMKAAHLMASRKPKKKEKRG
jgi:hypothetical protein